jgi:hypothetical protein
MATETVLPHPVWGQLMDMPGTLWLSAKLVELPILVCVTPQLVTDFSQYGHFPVDIIE